MITIHHPSLKAALLAGAALTCWPVLAAEVTPERLANPEPQNWLMNHRTYDGQRFSPLSRINKDNVKNLKLAYAVAIGGTSVGENLEATPLVEDGFMYVVDLWGIVYKIDVRSGDAGRIVWRMDPKQEKVPLSNRGAALWGNLVISTASYPPRVIGTDKDSGKIVWETNLTDDQTDVQLTAAPLAVKDKIIVGAAGGDRGVRDYIAGLDAKTGKLEWRQYVVPKPGEPGSETWKDNHNAWQTGGGAMWVTGTYDVASNQVIWGTGNPVPMFDATYRPGDNLYTDSVISWNPDSGKMNWYFQFTPGDHWDYDEEGTHILIDGQVNGEMRHLITHSARNGFLYTMERSNGQTVVAKPYLDNINWTKGIDQKTGKPVDYVPNSDIQMYAGIATPTLAEPTKKMCPSPSGGNNFWPSAYSPKTKLLYVPALINCAMVTQDPKESVKTAAGDMRGGPRATSSERSETDLLAIDPVTGETKFKAHVPYADYSGALSTAGGLIFTGYNDGTFAAYDDATLQQVWKINVGVGFDAPPMTFEVGGKQYVAILSGLSKIATGRNLNSPELKDQRNQTMLFVFGL
ncbi:MAG TPA: PQQ-binding-like beta-propeller repeat protein [Xanthobacteraceae bacterium]|nr:PQQ-binding-like beta-propeller repeat protein [Xanthobacteraceae bacterium]